MIEKMRSLNWSTYNSMLLIIANIIIVFATSKIILNTKEMENGKIIVSYIIIGLIALGLIKINNALTSHDSTN